MNNSPKRLLLRLCLLKTLGRLKPALLSYCFGQDRQMRYLTPLQPELHPIHD